MYWEIHPPRTERFPEGGDVATRGPRAKFYTPEHCQCYLREDVCQGSAARNTVPGAAFPNTLPWEQEVHHVLDNMIFEDHVIQYEDVHPYSVVNIDNVKINTTNDERMANIQTSAHGFMSKTWSSLIPDTRNTR